MDQLHQTNLRDQALAILKHRLVSGDLVPGEIYSAAAVALELGVSNSPVREAMLTLVNQGLMETVRNRGFRVIPLSDTERQNIYELRLMLEIPSMGRLASKPQVRQREHEFSRIATEIVKAARAGDIVTYLAADRRFHIGLLEILGNDRLVSIVDNLRDQTRQYGLKALAKQGTLVKSAEEHHPILKAIVAGDEAKTVRLMTEHLRHVRGDWEGANGQG